MARPDLKNPDLYVEEVPHDLFAQLRRTDPVYWNEESDGPGFWAVLRYADIVEVSRQPKLFSSAHANGGHRIFNENEVGLTGAGESSIGIPFISVDPPVHTQYRKMMMPAVSPGRLAGIEERIVERCRVLLDAIPLDQPVDMVQALSAPLPLMTLCELFDLPPQIDWHLLYDWTNAFVGEDDPDFRQSPEQMAQVLGSFFTMMGELFESRRQTPGQDLASLLANAQIDGQPTPFRDFLGNMILALVGANETTRNSLSHTIVNFARHPDQWQILRSNLDLLPGAVREMVRHASPVMHMRRTATEDTVLGDRRIAKGDKVVMWYTSANRDETVFERPNDFDITRGNIQHLGFGSGQHVCVGSRLAEMQLRVAFRLLAERVKGFELLFTPRRFRSNFINGLKNLDVKLQAG
ncbi:linalool 8-monooxygenase [Novosphingobium sediminicola]|uniref:Linalool 8-monooxygenase n=1 Tax=Novosphingobium sediminicola TaxID=563162 RepID=A0A7W6G8D7_9SPHN|nr:linalool 8-monooxygenase [Novosphingobium sediminicola]